MTRSTTTIPTPPEGRIVQAAVSTALAVPAGNGAVGYYYDDRTSSITITVTPYALDTRDLERVLTEQQLPGRTVVTVPLDCGGIDRDNLDITPEPTDKAHAVEAIPHLYGTLREPAERAALRVVYRALTRKEHLENV